MKTSPEVLEAVRAHGRDAYPEECCGLLLGTVEEDGNHAVVAWRVENQRAENRERRYTISPDDYRTADRAARERGLDIVGFYHSHPDHPARPSPTDLAEATFPGYTYLIVSVQRGTPADLTAWSLALDRSQFLPEPLDVPFFQETP